MANVEIIYCSNCHAVTAIEKGFGKCCSKPDEEVFPYDEGGLEIKKITVDVKIIKGNFGEHGEELMQVIVSSAEKKFEWEEYTWNNTSLRHGGMKFAFGEAIKRFKLCEDGQP